MLFFVCVGACVCDMGREEVRGQPCEVASLPLPLRGFWGLNSGLQLCVATVLPAAEFCCFRLGGFGSYAGGAVLRQSFTLESRLALNMSLLPPPLELLG